MNVLLVCMCYKYVLGVCMHMSFSYLICCFCLACRCVSYYFVHVTCPEIQILPFLLV
jgi:hypothetical protein